jgi:hypothetical protein
LSLFVHKEINFGFDISNYWFFFFGIIDRVILSPWRIVTSLYFSFIMNIMIYSVLYIRMIGVPIIWQNFSWNYLSFCEFCYLFMYRLYTIILLMCFEICATWNSVCATFKITLLKMTCNSYFWILITVNSKSNYNMNYC